MMLGQIGRPLLVCLILLLSVQFTGLNCLEDWKIASATDSQILSAPPADGAGKADHPADDGCPCHLSVAPVDRCILRIGYPLQPSALDAPPRYTLTLASLLFHPPILL
jgi:hypothetical protein